MKKSITVGIALLMAACTMCAGVNASAANASIKAANAKGVAKLSRMMGLDRQAAKRVADNGQVLRAPSASEASADMLPGKILMSTWNSGSWSQPTTILRSYNPDGTVSHETETMVGSDVTVHRDYTYNEDGLPVSVEENESHGDALVLIPVKRTMYVYDAVVKDFCVSEVTEDYVNGQWIAGDSEIHTVTRNADGNVTEVVYTEDGVNDTSLRIAYGQDGKASKISYYDYSDNEWELNTVIRDIVWHETDGQFMEPENFFMTGRNRISKCLVEVSDGEGDDRFTLDMEYAADGSCRAAMDGIFEGIEVPGSSISFTMLKNGGNEYRFSLNYGDEIMNTIYRYEYDARHNLLVYFDACEDISAFPYTEYYSYVKGEVYCNPETGLPMTYIVKSLPDDYGYEVSELYDEPDGLENVVKYRYYDYVTSGIDDIITDSEAPVEYYDLNGLRVDRPAHGIYIMRHNGKTAKVIL